MSSATRHVVRIVGAVALPALLVAGCAGTPTDPAAPATTAPPADEVPGTAPSPDDPPRPQATAASGAPTGAVVDGRPAGLEPIDVTGDAARIRVSGFAAGSAVVVEARPSDWAPDDLLADTAGVVDVAVPASDLRPGVTSIVFRGRTTVGTAVARSVWLRTPGTPPEGIYMTYLCCLDGGAGTEVEVTWLGERLTTTQADPEGGVLVEVPIFDLPGDTEQVILVEDLATGQVLREVVGQGAA